MERYNGEQLRDILLRIDEEISLSLGVQDPRYRVVIVGGSAFLLNDLTKRPDTHDIDVLQLDRRIAGILENYRMVNCAVLAHSNEIPHNFEDRLVSLELPTASIDYVTPCLEDLAVMKLYALRPNDIEDLSSPNVLARINWELLVHLVYSDGEAKASCQSDRRYQDPLYAYREYEGRYRNATDV